MTGSVRLTDQITVATVAWNSGSSLSSWCRAWDPLGCRLLVTDNASTDGVPVTGRAEVISSDSNLGFGGGINLAVRESRTPLVLITNPDTLPLDETSLGDLLRHHSPGSLSTGQLLSPAGTELSSGGIWPSTAWVAGQLFRPAASLWRKDRLDWIQGALILTERDLFLERLGGFSPDFPLYFEDTDLSARADAAGIGRNLIPSARFVHDQGTGAPAADRTRILGFHWGLWRWFVSHRSGQAGMVRALILLKCVGRLAAGRRRSRRGYAAAFRAVSRNEKPVLPACS
jgi:GT2 family glycosyltransferase